MDSCVLCLCERKAHFWVTAASPIIQKNGTARSSLALENLQEIEKKPYEQRKNAEAVLTGVLGSMYTGELPLLFDAYYLY